MARGSNLKGRWGNGQPYDSVRRTGFVENTITNPKAEAAPPENAARLMWVSDPWYVISGPGTGPTSGTKMRSAAGGSTGGDEPESRPHNAQPKTKIPTLPPFK
jgi:hypothetical protein